MKLLSSVVAGVLLVLVAGCGSQGKVKQTKHDVGELSLALDLYYTEHGAYPRGTTAEICRLLLGKTVGDQNQKQLSYIDAKGSELNAASEFVDPWGTPYRIIIGLPPRVYSCGPNKVDENGGGDDIAA